MTSARQLWVACASILASAAVAAPAMAQEAGSVVGLDEIVVTAQKREQSINDVGLTIQAATGDTLAERGITNVGDLGKLVPGFLATQSTFATPVYLLRGIGLYDSTIGASPAVAIYTDQTPRNFPMMSDALELDIERIEVLKGPQGTLFGQSSTGGAINFIVGKPTDTLQAGTDVSYERFGKADLSAFVSGPLSSTLKARLAVRGINGGAWQKSVTRDEENGETRKIMGRLSLDWDPTDAVSIETSFTGARDRSDTQAPQYAGSFYNIYSAASLAAANANPATANPYGYVDEDLYYQLTTPGAPGYRANHVTIQETAARRLNGVDVFNLSGLREGYAPPAARGLSVADAARFLLGTPIATGSSRAADWSAGFLRPSRNSYWQGTLRADFDLNDNLTVTSLSAYAKSKINHTIDLDGTAAWSINVPSDGSIKTFNQELRLAGKTDRLNWIVGVNYDNLKTQDNNDYLLIDFFANDPIGQAGIIVGGGPDFHWGPVDYTRNLFGTTMKTKAGFANAEFQIADKLSFSAGVRYTDNKQSATYCYNDISAQQRTGGLFTLLSLAVGGVSLTIPPGSCFTLGDANFAGLPNGVASLVPLKVRQNQDNWSFRGGLNYKLDNGGLLYVNVSQGYKAGVFSNIGASVISQYTPAVQEKLVSFEGGFKLPLAGNRMQLNASAFYYDYTDKQIRTKIYDNTWGLLEKLINVPKSYVWGFEAEMAARPMDGLTVSASATYLKTKVTSDYSTTPDGKTIFNSMGFTGSLKGSELPYTPEFSGNLDVQYEWNMGANLRPFLGGTLVYQGSSNATFENDVLRADFFEIPSYKTVDLRAGVGSDDGRWQVTVYGRNVFNEYIITSPTFYHDAYFKVTGKPAIYGASVKFRF